MNSYYPSIIDCFRYVALVIGVMALLRVLRGALWVKSLIAAILAILVIHLYAVSPLRPLRIEFPVLLEDRSRSLGRSGSVLPLTVC